jgi:hypothetical protein
MARTRLTPQQQIHVISLAVKKLADRKAKLLSRLAELNGESQRMRELLTSVPTVAGHNKASVAEVIKAVAKLERTGLKSEKASRKQHKPQTRKVLKHGRKIKVAAA